MNEVFVIQHIIRPFFFGLSLSVIVFTTFFVISNVWMNYTAIHFLQKPTRRILRESVPQIILIAVAGIILYLTLK